MALKDHFNNFFQHCRLLAETFDAHRHRDVKVYMIPGELSVVGVTDGVDCWAAPTVINPFSCDVPDLLRRILAGENVPVMRVGPTGRMVASKPEAQELPKTRRRLEPEQQPASRRRVLSLDYLDLELRVAATLNPAQRRRLQS